MKLDHKIGRSLKKASPTILTCIGAAGVVATAVLAVKATLKADSLIKADSRRNHDGDPYAATKLEAVKSCWKCYIPAAATGVATIICIFGANTLNKKQQASLASAYALVNRSIGAMMEPLANVVLKLSDRPLLCACLLELFFPLPEKRRRPCIHGVHVAQDQFKLLDVHAFSFRPK